MASVHMVFSFVKFFNEEQILQRMDGPPSSAHAFVSGAGIMLAALRMSARGRIHRSLALVICGVTKVGGESQESGEFCRENG